ncbi:hypothetical protein B0T22DRAFT_246194 [Podospora appendiculata]|uniref:Uncharacterized protein n=1 Tax=Podospora appendiculata TaxID=314037 RepID=A0AAE1C8T1_9PEZI|nr:hypothetical protein B0T22DRAFT_246194 [Podospora appendiculata]
MYCPGTGWIPWGRFSMPTNHHRIYVPGSQLRWRDTRKRLHCELALCWSKDCMCLLPGREDVGTRRQISSPHHPWEIRLVFFSQTLFSSSSSSVAAAIPISTQGNRVHPPDLCKVCLLSTFPSITQQTPVTGSETWDGESTTFSDSDSDTTRTTPS